MSPVSRGRKSKQKTGRKEPQLDPDRRDAFDLLLSDFAEVSTSDDALDVELLMSGCMASWWEPAAPEESNRVVGFPMIAYAAGERTPAGLGLLRAMQALGVTAGQRDRAGAAADRMAESGVPEPSWGEGLRQVTVSECWQQTDVYGDGASLLFICDRAGRRHGMVVEVGFNGNGVEDAFLTAEPDEILREMREADESGELVVTEQLALPRARRIVEDAVSINDSVAELLPVSDHYDSFTEARAYLLARLRAMPPADVPAEPAEYRDAERDDLVRQFFADTETPDDFDARQIARAVVDYGCDKDSGRPLRVSPEKLEILLDELSEGLDEDAVEELLDVLVAWADWAGRRSGLSEEAIGALLDDLDETVAELFETGEGWEDDLADDPGEDLDERQSDIPIALRRR